MSALRTSAAVETAWAKAMYLALLESEATPIFNQLAAEMGNPLAVERLAG